MKLDVETLGTFYEMAREGAGLAASRLTPMTEIQTRVGVTRLNFTTPEVVRTELADEVRKVGIRVSLTGGIEGTSLVLFDEDSAMEVAAALLEETSEAELTESAIVEVCQIMNNGFVDGWADVLGAEIEVSTPTYVAGVDPDVFVTDDDVDAADGLAVTFRSEIETVGTEVRFQHYFVPDREAITELFGRREGDRSIEYENLAGFDRMAKQGVETVASNLTKMTGIEVAVDLRRINFISLDAIPEDVSNERLVSVAFSFDGMPSGYLLFLFDRPSAGELVEATLGSTPTDAFGDLERDAIKEVSNVMASGLLDGWANLLETSIDHSTPAYTYDMGAAVVDPLVVGLIDRQEFAFVFDTHIEAVDSELDVDIYVIPDEADLERALDSVDVHRVDDTPVTAETGGVDFPGESDPADVDFSGDGDLVETVDAEEFDLTER